jgi:hypothetical protein
MTIKVAIESKGKSPYARHKKVPTLYSPEYQNWREAVRKGNPAGITHWGALHDKRFKPTAMHLAHNFRNPAH